MYRLPACRCQFAPALSALVTSDDRPGRGGVVSAASQWQRCLLTVVLSMCAARWMTRPASVSDRLSWCDGLTGCVEQHSPNRAPRRHAVYFQLHLNGECLLAVVLSMCAARCMTRPASVSVRASWIRGDGPAARPAGGRVRACVDPPNRGTCALVSLCRRPRRSTWVYFRPAWTCVCVVFALDWTLRPSLGWTRCTTSRAQIIEYPILYYTIYLGTCSPAARHMLRPDRDREVLHWPCGPLYIARSPVLAALTWLPPFVVLLLPRASA